MADKGYGAKFFWKVTSPATTEVLLVTAIAPPGIEVEDIDVSVMQSTDQWREFISGWKVGGEAGVTIQYTKAETAALFAQAAIENFFIIEFSDGSEWAFKGYINNFGDELDIDGIVSTALTIKITGVPTFTPSA